MQLILLLILLAAIAAILAPGAAGYIFAGAVLVAILLIFNSRPRW